MRQVGTLGAPRAQTCAKGLRPLDSIRRIGLNGKANNFRLLP